ncbi:MAG TPA: ribosome recycling factor [Firmicutes bacterium]|nr:ribosome recycling factor [Bacillota bacterium]
MATGQIEQEAEGKMKKTLESLRKELASLRAGRATPALLEKVLVDYYGSPTPVNQVANVSVPEPRLLVIQPWDRSMLNTIEKAILKSDLGLTPSSDGVVIRLAIPRLTEERRRELSRVVKKKAEEAKVAIRNIRREANESLKRLQKEGSLSEDEEKKRQEAVQKLTDTYSKEVDDLAQTKEKEIMSV